MKTAAYQVLSFILYIMGSMSLLEWVQGSLSVLPKDEEMLEMDGVRPNLSSLTFSYYCPTSPPKMQAPTSTCVPWSHLNTLELPRA